MVVAINLLRQDCSGVFQLTEPFQGIGADDAVLQPAIGPRDLAPGLGERATENSPLLNCK